MSMWSSPSDAAVSGDLEVAGRPSGDPSRGMLVFLCLITAAWISALIYGVIQSVAFVRGLI